jgi:hypothetical protein
MDEYWKFAEKREIRHLPPCAAELRVNCEKNGLTIDFSSTKATRDVPTQIALDFPPGVEVLLPGKKPRKLGADEIDFIPPEGCEVRSSKNAWRIGGGGDAHRMTVMRAADGTGGCARLIIPLVTPVRHTVKITRIA